HDPRLVQHQNVEVRVPAVGEVVPHHRDPAVPRRHPHPQVLGAGGPLVNAVPVVVSQVADPVLLGAVAGARHHQHARGGEAVHQVVDRARAVVEAVRVERQRHGDD
ncbi:MAG: hypothetical protein ACK559_08740, partial [bacterium]